MNSLPLMPPTGQKQLFPKETVRNSQLHGKEICFLQHTKSKFLCKWAKVFRHLYIPLICDFRRPVYILLAMSLIFKHTPESVWWTLNCLRALKTCALLCQRAHRESIYAALEKLMHLNNLDCKRKWLLHTTLCVNVCARLYHTHTTWTHNKI